MTTNKPIDLPPVMANIRSAFIARDPDYLTKKWRLGGRLREWRASFLSRTPARAARRKVMNWKPDRLLIAHGKSAKTRTPEVIKEALSWI